MASVTKTDEVIEQISQRILEGVYKPGQRLPPERELIEELHVSRPIIRNALLRLQAENKIDIRPRDGAFVRSPSAKVLIGPTAPTVGKKDYTSLFTNAIQMQRNEMEVRFVEPTTVVQAESELALKAEVEVGTELLRTYQIYLVNQVPYRTKESYSLASFMRYMGAQSTVGEPPIQNKPTISRVLGRGSQVKIQSTTYKAGVDENFDDPEFEMLFNARQTASPHAFERFNCRIASPQEAELLHMSKNQPVIDVERWSWLSDHTLLEYVHVVANASLHEYTYAYEEADSFEALTHKMAAGS